MSSYIGSIQRLVTECLIMVFRAGTLSPCSGSSGEACSVAARHLCFVVALSRPRRSSQRRGPLACVCQRKVCCHDISTSIFISMPEERLAGACSLTIATSEHSVDDSEKPPGRPDDRIMRRKSAGNLLLQRSRIMLRLRCKNGLGPSMHLFEEAPAAAADAAGPEFVDQRHLCAMHLRETVPEPTLRRRGVAESC